MTGPSLADVFEHFIDDYTRERRLSDDQYRAVNDIRRCRTPALGLRAMAHCVQCGYHAPHYCSCRNRHCPKCQSGAQTRWVDQQCEDVLDVPYYHLVFTLPHELNALARSAPRVVYGALFDAVWHTLHQLGRQRLGGQIGMTAVLHTWGQTLSTHIHLHCLIPAGAFDARARRWQRASSRYLFPVKVMQPMFRGRMTALLRRAHDRLGVDRAELSALLNGAYNKAWNVYAKPVLGHADQVLRYLGRYTHRIALSESRLLEVADEQVRFRYRDYRQAGRARVLSLAGTEFVRRYLVHVVPRGFQRVRHYGFLSNRCRRQRVERIRSLLPPRRRDRERTVASFERCCPACGAPMHREVSPETLNTS